MMQQSDRETLVMEKLDAHTPWHVLRTYPNEAQAKCAAYGFAKRHPKGEHFPKYSVNGRAF
jgi:hypothetical protein